MNIYIIWVQIIVSLILISIFFSKLDGDPGKSVEIVVQLADNMEFRKLNPTSEIKQINRDITELPLSNDYLWGNKFYTLKEDVNNAVGTVGYEQQIRLRLLRSIKVNTPTFF